MIEILKGGIGGNGCIARATGRQDVCTTILPPGALAGKQAFRKHFVSCNQTRDPFSSCVDLDYTLVQIHGKYFLDPGTENVSPIAKKNQVTQQSANWGNQPAAEDGFSFRRRGDSFPVATTFTGVSLALAGTPRLCTPHLGGYISVTMKTPAPRLGGADTSRSGAYFCGSGPRLAGSVAGLAFLGGNSTAATPL